MGGPLVSLQMNLPIIAAQIVPEIMDFVPNHGSGPHHSPPSNFESLLANHHPLVKSIVDRMKRQLPARIEIEDLYSVGVTGLVAAAQNFRETKSKSFIRYASIRLRKALLAELRRMNWMSRSGRSTAKQLGALISQIEQ